MTNGVMYTFVAYRPNGVDSIRNCVMGQTDSDFRIQSSTNPNKIVSIWLETLQQDYMDRKKYPYAVASWEVYLLRNGDCCLNYGEPYSFDLDAMPDYASKWAESIFHSAIQKFNEWKLIQEGESAKAAAMKEAARLADEETREKAELDRLIEKYHGKRETYGTNS